MQEVSKHLKSLYKHTRYTSDENIGPLDQPKHFTKLPVIQCKGFMKTRQGIKFAMASASGNTTSFFSNESLREKVHSKMARRKTKSSKDIADIFAPFDDSDSDTSPTTILIEGAPGIGKTTLSKEIAFQWAEGTLGLLSKMVFVFLLFLIDPLVQKISNLTDLVQYFYPSDDCASQISKSCAEYLIKSEGHNVMFILDGYDEYQSQFHYADDFIQSLLKRKVLPESNHVITSRGCQIDLIYNTDRHVIILGFTDDERKDFVEHSLGNQQAEITELLDYLHDHSTINNLCYIPFNMTVLLYLYKERLHLPKNSTELYNHFICGIIYRHLAQHGTYLESIVDLSSIPHPFNKVIDSLAALAFKATQNWEESNHQTFTWEEIVTAYPEIEQVPGAINGLGLLQAVQYYNFLQKSVVLNFIHQSVQEYLAAYHITCIPQQEDEIDVLCGLFFSTYQNKLNVMMMYIGLTKAQRPAFKRFLERDHFSVHGYLNTSFFSSFFLYRCLYEADDMQSCFEISKSFHDSRIGHYFCPPFRISQLWIMEYSKRYRNALPPNEVENLTYFLVHQEPGSVWKELCLDGFYIGDMGCQILHQGLIPNATLTIEEVDLSNNSLTSQSAGFVADIVIHCKCKELRAMENKLGAEAFDKLLCDSSSVLEQLNWDKNHLSSTEAIILFKALRKCGHLKVLEISDNEIDDTATKELCITLTEHRTLKELWITGNPITGQAVLSIVQSLKENTTLEFLWLPSYNSKEMEDKIKMEEQKINDYRKSQQCMVELQVHLTGVYKDDYDVLILLQ